MQSIQKNLIKNIVIESLIVYENSPKISISKRNEELLIFTSPMSAEAYFSQHTQQPNQTIISIGNTTTKKLKALGISEVRTAFEPSNWSILDNVF